ncbi:MAG TPA: rhomboid family intramembrane serine protease [Allosphingosinicella sp.]|nr:rhomboid family intramembrane serine protease [Allosphingosinicella sp.]
MRPPADWRRAKATLALAGLSTLVWAVSAGLDVSNIAAVWGGFIPHRVEGLAGDEALAPVFLTPLTSAFIHAGFVHLAFNMLILLFCGRAVENILGMGAILTLYLTGAYAAAGVHYLLDPADLTPMVGASGAIAAVLGTYAMLFGRNRVKIANPTVALWVNAVWLAAAWIGLQILLGLTFTTAGAKLAVGAHIGGFLAGLLLAKPLLLFRYRKA